MSLSLQISALHIPFRTSFKHASADRKLGESIWVEARRGEAIGLGEGCPRVYVTGEDVESGIAWLSSIQDEIETKCTSLARLLDWVMQQRERIDAHPAAWCAIEIALLDLFAREEGVSVEVLLGLDPPERVFTYTAVLGNSAPEVFKKRVEMYLQYGFSDFKVKLEGDSSADQVKLNYLLEQYRGKGKGAPRIRLDANNYWREAAGEAIAYIKELGIDVLGIEEPVEPGNPMALSEISTALGTAAILDESLCRLQQLEAFDTLPGQFIANLKVSRVGGVLRAMELVQALKVCGWPIILGAHVGETSVLTRASMCVAQVAGDALIAQEGAFGTRLLEYDKVTPGLMFGSGGRLHPGGAEGQPPLSQSGWGVELV